MGDFENVVNAARDFACGLYKNRPGEIIPNPIDDGLFAVWDKLCGEPPKTPSDLPPPPATPFTGGQCCDAAYRVYYTRTIDGGAPQNLYDDLPTGKIIGAIKTVSGATASWAIRYQNCAGVSTDKPQYSAGINSTLTITSVSRLSGNTSNCGDPPKQYPPAAPPPASGYTSPPTAINLNTGDTYNLIFNLKPPTRSGNPSDLFPPIKIDINNPKLNLTIPLTFNFNGSINIGAPSGGGGFSDSDRDKLNNINNKTNNTNDTTNNINVTLNNVNTNINNDINNGRNRRRPDSDFSPPPSPKPPGKHEQEYLEAVEVKLLSVPRNAKKQSGGASPDVVYAGWFEFTRKGKSLPRDPIHFEGSVFKAPEGADGYAYTLYTGYTGEATPIINKAVT